jgi:hypothetical protein
MVLAFDFLPSGASRAVKASDRFLHPVKKIDIRSNDTVWMFHSHLNNLFIFRQVKGYHIRLDYWHGLC